VDVQNERVCGGGQCPRVGPECV